MSLALTDLKITPMSHYFPNGSNHANRLAGAVDWLGHKLTYTISLALMDVTKIFRAIHLDLHDQCTKVPYEIGMRMLRASRVVILMPINLTIGLVGVALRALATFARTDMTFVAPKTLPLSSEPCKKLRVRTFNVAMTPNFITVPNGVRPVDERIKEVANAMIARLSAGDHITCVQELFHTEAAEYLVQRLKKEFPDLFIIYNVAHNRLVLNSGLLIASKYPLTAPLFWKSPRSEGYSTFANIGHLIVTVLLSSTQKLVLSNTHLNTDGDQLSDNYTGAKCRKEQFQYIETHMQEYLVQNPSQNNLNLIGYLHSGDFNMDLDEEWSKCKELQENYEHNFSAQQHNRPTVFDTRKYPTCWDTKRIDQWKGSMDEQVDYVLVPKKYSETIKGTMHFDDMEGSSDHRAVVADLTIQNP